MTLRLERDNEVVLISPYGFEWYVDTELARAGLVEDFEADVEALQDEGFELVNWPALFIARRASDRAGAFFHYITQVAHLSIGNLNKLSTICSPKFVQNAQRSNSQNYLIILHHAKALKNCQNTHAILHYTKVLKCQTIAEIV
jgi:hypothetical protein